MLSDNMQLSTIALGIGGGLFLGWMLRGRYLRQSVGEIAKIGQSSSECSIMSNNGDYKLVLVVRTDLKMGKGKAAAQCAHAAVGCYKKLARKDPEMLACWEDCGQPKVVVKTDSADSLYKLAKHAKSLGLNHCVIADAGRTQIVSGSKTVLGVGPGPAGMVDEVTGALKLY